MSLTSILGDGAELFRGEEVKSAIHLQIDQENGKNITGEPTKESGNILPVMLKAGKSR